MHIATTADLRQELHRRPHGQRHLARARPARRRPESRSCRHLPRRPASPRTTSVPIVGHVQNLACIRLPGPGSRVRDGLANEPVAAMTAAASIMSPSSVRTLNPSPACPTAATVVPVRISAPDSRRTSPGAPRPRRGSDTDPGRRGTAYREAAVARRGEQRQRVVVRRPRPDRTIAGLQHQRPQAGIQRRSRPGQAGLAGTDDHHRFRGERHDTTYRHIVI